MHVFIFADIQMYVYICLYMYISALISFSHSTASVQLVRTSPSCRAWAFQWLVLGDCAVPTHRTSPQACGWATHIKQVGCKDPTIEIVAPYDYWTYDLTTALQPLDVREHGVSHRTYSRVRARIDGHPSLSLSLSFSPPPHVCRHINVDMRMFKQFYLWKYTF